MKKATEKQKKAIKLVVENGGNVSKAMRDAGYSKETAKTPQKLTESITWRKLMDKYLPDNDLAKIHQKLLKKEDIIPKFDSKTGKLKLIKTNQPHTDVKQALDMAYKLKGLYTPEKKEIDLKNKTDDDLKNEVVKKLADLLK